MCVERILSAHCEHTIACPRAEVIELVLIFALGPFCWLMLGVASGAMASTPDPFSVAQLKVCILSFQLPSACFSNTCMAIPLKVAGLPLASFP